MFPEWTWIVGFYIGAAVGSFLNVVIYRMPRAISLGNPRHSFCPACDRRLGLPDMVPLLSWLFLRGRCRTCRARISARYFWVELLNASLWGALWYLLLVQSSEPARFIAYALMVSALLAALTIDLAFFIIPDQINAFLLIVGLLYNAVLAWQGSPDAYTLGMPSALAGALAGTLLLWGIAVFGRVLFRADAMGHGDIKLARGIGAIIFVAPAFMSFAIAIVLGAVLGVVQILLRKEGGRPATLGKAGGAEDPDEEEPYQPESYGSLLRCGLGYLLAIDVIGLFIPVLYFAWFGEDPFAPDADDWETADFTPTTIPFGPYLAAGAMICALFGPQLNQLLQTYLKYIQGETG